MNLAEYFDSPGAMSISALREHIGVKSDMQIRQWQHGYANRRPSPANCVAIRRATNGLVTLQELRPDDWQAIWPELADKQEATNA